MLTHDRLFVSVMQGRIPNRRGALIRCANDLALDGVKAVTEAAALSLAHMVFVNPYLTVKIPTKVMNEHYARRFEFGNSRREPRLRPVRFRESADRITGVAVRDLLQRRSIRPKIAPPSPTAALASLPERHCTVRQRADLFPGRTACTAARLPSNCDNDAQPADNPKSRAITARW
jgi:enamine deaminase RidA (YjgF/YER057c/UK114 family)